MKLRMERSARRSPQRHAKGQQSKSTSTLLKMVRIVKRIAVRKSDSIYENEYGNHTFTNVNVAFPTHSQIALSLTFHRRCG
jgi:hypothetical protein